LPYITLETVIKTIETIFKCYKCYSTPSFTFNENLQNTNKSHI